MPDGTINTTGGQQEGSTLVEQHNHLSVKYDMQVPFLLGTASVLLPNVILEGWQCVVLGYTDHFTLTHTDFWV
jgi:hypothetical protein